MQKCDFPLLCQSECFHPIFVFGSFVEHFLDSGQQMSSNREVN